MQQNQYPPAQMYPAQTMNQGDPQQQFEVVQIKNGLQKLADAQGIFINQRFEVLEALTGFEIPNVYKVYPADINGQKIGDKTIFKCKEKSNVCVRQCLSSDCRPFQMKVGNEQGQIKNGEFDKTLFMNFERPFKCTCCCLARPEMTISFVENGQNKIFGKVKNPCMFFSLGCNVEDENVLAVKLVTCVRVFLATVVKNSSFRQRTLQEKLLQNLKRNQQVALKLVLVIMVILVLDFLQVLPKKIRLF